MSFVNITWIIGVIFAILMANFGLLHAQLENKEDVRIINITITDFDKNAVNGQAVSEQTVLLPKSIAKILVTNVPPEVAFLIVQAHSQEFNIAIGYDKTFGNKSSVEGSNLGLVVQPENSFVFLRNDNNANITVLVAVVYYTAKGPTPGGCNMEFNVETSPFQKVFMTNATIEIDAQPASDVSSFNKPLSCENSQVTYEAYRLYIPEKDFTPETYFATISKMLTVADIEKNGIKVPAAILTSKMKRVYSAYTGTGSAYAMIATHGNFSSAYVTAFSYACEPFSNLNSCYLLNESMSKFVCALILFVGLYLTFVGHASVCMEIFLLGSVCGGIGGYIFLSLIGYETMAGHVGWSFVIGLAIGVIAVVIGYIGMPLVPILQGSLTLGCLAASTMYFGISDGMPMFQNNINFWSIYLMIMVIIPLVFCKCHPCSNITCCAFFGAYLIIMPFDYWLGSSLKYIVINTIRRLTISDFSIATINPPFQYIDLVLAVSWAILTLWGIKKQKETLNGRLGFPSHATSVWSEERIPSLSASRNGRRVLVLDENDQVYQCGLLHCCR